MDTDFCIGCANNGHLPGAVSASSGEAALEASKAGTTRLTLRSPANATVRWSVTWTKSSGE